MTFFGSTNCNWLVLFLFCGLFYIILNSQKIIGNFAIIFLEKGKMLLTLHKESYNIEA